MTPAQYTAAGKAWLQRVGNAAPGSPSAGAGLFGLYEGFKKGGPLDAQIYLADDKGAYAYGNLTFGAFMAGAGFSLQETLFFADTYGIIAQRGGAYQAQKEAGRMSGNIPVDNVLNITNGYNSSGKLSLCR